MLLIANRNQMQSLLITNLSKFGGGAVFLPLFFALKTVLFEFLNWMFGIGFNGIPNILLNKLNFTQILNLSTKAILLHLFRMISILAHSIFIKMIKNETFYGFMLKNHKKLTYLGTAFKCA